MRKPECEKAIRSLVSVWAAENGIRPGSAEMPDFGDFVRWLRARGGGRYLDFRSTMGPLEDAELWFDEELKQTWRR